MPAVHGMTAAVYPVSCECGARAVGALVSDPSVPLYACGSWGGRSCPHVRSEDPPFAVENVVPLTPQDIGELAELVAFRLSPDRIVGPVAVTWDEDDVGLTETDPTEDDDGR